MTVVVLLVLIDLLVISIAIGGARDHELTVRRIETVEAFYAAESGMNMAIRELMVENDEDLDGGTGTISDDSNPDNDPDIGGAQVFVTATSSGGFVTTLTSQARAGDALRVLKASFE